MTEIVLTNSKLKAIVNPEDYSRINKDSWYLLKNTYVNYAQRTRDGVGMHRIILGIEGIKDRQGEHINKNGLDNRKSNLRICTNQENSFNKEKNKNNTSGYKGVTKHNDTKWRARIKFDYKLKHLGLFNTSKEAAIMYDRVALYYFPNFIQLNFEDSRLLKSLSLEECKIERKKSNKLNLIKKH